MFLSLLFHQQDSAPLFGEGDSVTKISHQPRHPQMASQLGSPWLTVYYRRPCDGRSASQKGLWIRPGMSWLLSGLLTGKPTGCGMSCSFHRKWCVRDRRQSNGWNSNDKSGWWWKYLGQIQLPPHTSHRFWMNRLIWATSLTLLSSSELHLPALSLSSYAQYPATERQKRSTLKRVPPISIFPATHWSV